MKPNLDNRGSAHLGGLSLTTSIKTHEVSTLKRTTQQLRRPGTYAKRETTPKVRLEVSINSSLRRVTLRASPPAGTSASVS